MEEDQGEHAVDDDDERVDDVEEEAEGDEEIECDRMTDGSDEMDDDEWDRLRSLESTDRLCDESDDDSSTETNEGRDVFMNTLVMHDTAGNATAASSKLTQQAVEATWPDFKGVFGRKGWSKVGLDNANKLRRSIGPFVYAATRQKPVPVLGVEELFPGKPLGQTLEDGRRTRMINDALVAFRGFVPDDKSQAVVRAAWEEYSKQALTKSGGDEDAPPLSETIQYPAYDEDGALCLGDGIMMPMPLDEARFSKEHVCNSVISNSAPPEATDMDEEVWPDDVGIDVAHQPDEIIPTPAPPVRPRYNNGIAEYVLVGHGMLPSDQTKRGRPSATFRLIESGAYASELGMDVQFEAKHPMFSACSFVLVDAVRFMLLSAAANAVRCSPMSDHSNGSDVVDGDVLSTHADEFRAWAQLCPFLNADETTKALDAMEKKPTRSALERIKEHKLSEIANLIPEPGSDSPALVAKLTVWMAGMRAETSQKQEWVGSKDMMSFVFAMDTMTVVTDRSHTVVHRLSVDPKVEESGFTLRLKNKETGESYRIEDVPRTPYALTLHVTTLSAPDQSSPTTNYDTASFRAQEALYSPLTWTQHRVADAETRAENARVRASAYETSFLALRTSLFDIDALMVVFGYETRSVDEQPQNKKSKAGCRSPSQEALLRLFVNESSFRESDRRIRVKPRADEEARVPTVYVCHKNTNEWSRRIESNRYKDSSTRPHGEDSTQIHTALQAALIAARTLVNAPLFYDAAYSMVQVALCLRNSKKEADRGRAARVLCNVNTAFTAQYDEMLPCGGDKQKLSVADWCKLLRNQALTSIDRIENNAFPSVGDSKAFLDFALDKINHISHGAMPELSGDSPHLLFCPSGYFCTQDRRVYYWTCGKLVSTDLRSSHRFDAGGVSRGRPNHAWVTDGDNIQKMRAVLGVDFKQCIIPKKPEEAATAPSTPLEEERAAQYATRSAAQAYQTCIDTADALAKGHPDQARAKRVFRMMVRTFGYEGGLDSLLFELAATLFACSDASQLIILTSPQDQKGGYIPGGGKTSILKLVEMIMSDGRCAFLQSADLSQSDGGTKPCPALAKAIDMGALQLVVDDIQRDGHLNTETINTLVSGNQSSSKSPWRGLHTTGKSLMVRVVTLWCASNYPEALARVIGGGSTRRANLIATLGTYISQDVFAKFGNFASREAALDSFHNNPREFAMQMMEHANVNRVPDDPKYKARLVDVGANWHLVFPEEITDNLRADSDCLLDFILLYAAQRSEGMPTSTTRPTMGPHTKEIFDSLASRHATEREKAARTQQNIHDKATLSDHQLNLARDAASSCIILAHPDPMSMNGTHVQTKLNAPPDTYDALFTFFVDRYEEVDTESAETSDAGFLLKHMAEQLASKNSLLYETLRKSYTPQPPKGSLFWLFEQVNHAISFRNGNVYDDSGGSPDEFAKTRVTRPKQDNRETIKRPRNFKPRNCTVAKKMAWVVRGWKVRSAGNDNTADTDGYANSEYLFMEAELRKTK